MNDLITMLKLVVIITGGCIILPGLVWLLIVSIHCIIFNKKVTASVYTCDKVRSVHKPEPRERDYYLPMFEYTYNNANYYSSCHQIGAKYKIKFRIGSKRTIRVNPKHPSEIYFVNPQTRTVMIIIIIILGLLVALCGASLFILI